MNGRVAKRVRRAARQATVGAPERDYTVRDHYGQQPVSRKRPNAFLVGPAHAPYWVARNRKQVLLVRGCTRHIAKMFKRTVLAARRAPRHG